MAINYNLSVSDLKEIKNRTGTDDLSRTQFNIRTASGQIIPAGINPEQAATINIGGQNLKKIGRDYLKSEGGRLTNRAGAGLTGPGASNVWVMPDGTKREVGKDFYKNIGREQLRSRGENVIEGGVSDRSTSQGANIAASFKGQNVVDPNVEIAKALKATPLAPPGTISQPDNPNPDGNLGLVDWLAKIGEPMPNWQDRVSLAQKYGISNYTGTEYQNNRLQSLLQQNHDNTGSLLPTTDVPVSPTPAINTPAGRQSEIDDINAQIKSKTDQVLALMKKSMGNTVDETDSAKIIKSINDSFEDKQNEEKPKSLAEQLASERAKLGVGDLETSLATADEDIARLRADLASTQESEEGRQVSTLQIGRRQTEVQRQFNKQLRDLEVTRNGIVNRLNQKLSVIDATMKYMGKDYDNAQEDYKTKFNQATKIADLFSGIEDKAKTEAERATDNARANVQVMISSLKDKSISYDSLDNATRLAINNMEVQAGQPVGFMKTVMDSVEDPIVTIKGSYTDDQGNRIIPVVTQNADGSVSVKNIISGKANISGKDPSFKLLQKQINLIAEYKATEAGKSIDLNKASSEPAYFSWIEKIINDDKTFKGGNAFLLL